MSSLASLTDIEKILALPCNTWSVTKKIKNHLWVDISNKKLLWVCSKCQSTLALSNDRTCTFYGGIKEDCNDIIMERACV